MSTRPSCLDCRFFRSTPEEFRRPTGTGECRRYPPAVTYKDVDSDLWAEFPLIPGDEFWCGEFIPATKGQPE